MADLLFCKSEEWKSMPRNNTDEIKAADDFYNEYLLPLVAEKFLQRYADEERHELMYLTIGSSWQPIALSILLHQPKKVIFLSTEGVRREVDAAVAYLGDRMPEYDVHIVDKGDSKKMLTIVADTFDEHGKPTDCCFDITGGTKAMSAAAAMIAAHLDIKIFYIESNYLPVYRHPEPGSEKIVAICRPQDL